jgi:hypothetical protein
MSPHASMGGASAARSPIASTDVHPASTAAAAIARIEAIVCRTRGGSADAAAETTRQAGQPGQAPGLTQCADLRQSVLLAKP